MSTEPSVFDQEISTAALLVSLSHIEHTFTPPSGKVLTVLSDITLSLREGELAAILGPSGCGKSTLVRIAAGLLHPSRGEVRYRNQPVRGPNPHVALVFQQFALFPWLTVAQNIEQVLIPRGIAPEARRQRVADVISLIGLDGFEEAYPRELSGGMRQRVGMARALVVQPELLCMDEPFSQVDALTAETLRTEVINLWRDRQRYPQSVLMVSHDIHEVAFMASRIFIMTANPGRVKMVLDHSLPYPRDPRSPAYQAFVDKLHNIITGLYIPEEAEPVPPIVATPATTTPSPSRGTIAPIPLVAVRDVIGLLEAVSARGGSVELFRITTEMGRNFTRTILAVKAAELLGFLQTPQDELVLTELGRQCVAAPRKSRRHLFQAQVVQIPLVKRLREMLEHAADHELTQDVLLEELAIQCPQEDPKRLLRVLINWGKYAELWTSKPATGTLSINGSSRSTNSPQSLPDGQAGTVSAEGGSAPGGDSPP